MKHFDIIILGAGAAGCMCALKACESGKSILLIDKLAKAGKKLMATGNGRCNLSNKHMLPSYNYFNCDIDTFFERFSNLDVIAYFNSLGLLTYTDEEGRVYPFTNSAKSVIDIINQEIENNNNITLSLEDEIQNVLINNSEFIITTLKDQFICKKLIIATGGKGAEKIINMLNFNYSPLTPSLVALKTNSTRNLDGIRVNNVKLTATCGNNCYSEIGEILFKDSGISGIVAFNASTLFARNKNFNGEIFIDLMPEVSESQLKTLLFQRKNMNKKIKYFFDGMFVSQIGYHILNESKIANEERLCKTLSENEIDLFVKIIKNMEFKVKGHYENNQVYSGGIKLEDLTENLESKKIKNLYFCGEICDVDGICGGYNLQWAWTSGAIVGESL